MLKKFPNANIVSSSEYEADLRQAQIFNPDPNEIRRGGIAPWRSGKSMKQGDTFKVGSGPCGDGNPRRSEY